jgi:nitrous oxide reductase accessory protein NosL
MRRRTTLVACASLFAASGSSGCLGGVTGATGGTTPTPFDLSGSKADDRGGMVVGRHGGPNGQIFYERNGPAGHDGPAWFHTLASGLFPYHFERERRGWTAAAIYVTDYSTVDYDLFEGDGRAHMPSPTGAETFGDGTTATYVGGSSVFGGMGPDLFPFSDAADARAFVDRHSGRTITFDEITPHLIAGYTRR